MINKQKYNIYLFPVLVWMIAYFGFSFDGLYGQDAYEYLRYTEALKTFLTTAKPPGDYFWGVYYPILAGFLSFITQNTIMALQLVSVISLVFTAVYTDKIIRLVYKEYSLKNIIFLFLTISPFMLIHSLLSMSDMLACCFITLSIYHLLIFRETSANKSFFFGIIFVAFSLLTRYASLVILFPFFLIAFIQLVKTRNYKLLLFSSLTAVLIALPHILIRSQNSLDFLSHQWLHTWNIHNLFKSSFITADGEMHNHFINLIYAFFPFFHPAFLVFGFVLLLFFIRNRNYKLQYHQKLLLITILLYAIFLGGIPFQNKRFLLLSYPLVIVFLFPFIKQLFAFLKHSKLVFFIVFIVQICLGVYVGKSFFDRNSLEKTVCQEMKKYQGKTLYVFDIDIAMKGRNLDFNYKNLWKTKYSGFDKNALILVNEKQITEQWKGKNPLLNWENINNNYELVKLKSFSGDFNLYRIDAEK